MIIMSKMKQFYYISAWHTYFLYQEFHCTLALMSHKVITATGISTTFLHIQWNMKNQIIKMKFRGTVITNSCLHFLLLKIIKVVIQQNFSSKKTNRWFTWVEAHNLCHLVAKFVQGSNNSYHRRNSSCHFFMR